VQVVAQVPVALEAAPQARRQQSDSQEHGAVYQERGCQRRAVGPTTDQRPRGARARDDRQHLKHRVDSEPTGAALVCASSIEFSNRNSTRTSRVEPAATTNAAGSGIVTVVIDPVIDTDSAGPVVLDGPVGKAEVV